MLKLEQTIDYTINNCAIMAKFCQAIYPDSKIDLAQLANDYGLGIKWYVIDNHLAAICTGLDYAIIIYCGTNDIKDFLNDINYIQELIPGTQANVHRGFNRAYNQLSNKIGYDIQRLITRGKRLFITGHSLGGAIARRSTFFLKHYEACCYTFGSPRVGDHAFNNGCSISHYRIVNGLDPVPHLPPKRLPLTGGRYEHKNNKRILINHDGKISEERSTWDYLMEVITGGIDDIFDADLVPNSIEDHFIDNYVLHLVNAAGDK